jgi:hypothetical protein
MPAIACIFFAAGASCFAQIAIPAAGTAAAIPTGKVDVPEGTQVHVSLLKSLKSGGNKAGEEVPFEVAKDVYGPGHILLIAADTQAFGKVVESSRRGMFGKSGKLKFTIDYILASDKTHIPLRADAQIVRGRDNRTASIATAIILAPIAIFINGKDVSVNKGQDFVMYVNSDTIIQSPLIVPAAPAADVPAVTSTAQSLFLLTDGTQVQGTLTSFDGSQYIVATSQGTRTLKTSDVKSVFALAPTPAAAAH